MRRPVTGLGAWLVQRASAVYSLFFIVFVLVHFLVNPLTSYVAWHDWVLSRGVSIAASVAIGYAATVVPMRIGTRAFRELEA